MQSFRERSGGYHSNQPCYQQEPHELSRLETYRQHPHHPHPQHPHPGPGPNTGPGPGPTSSGYEAHSLANPTSMPPAGGPGTVGVPKDCYSQQTYPGYPGGGNGSGNGGSAPSQAKKSYRGSKVAPPNPSQHLQGPAGYSNHMGPGSYSAQYMTEGPLQQKWEDSAQLAQYDQEMVGRMEAGGTPAPVPSQYMDQNMLGHSQTQCHQPSTPAYTSPHHQPHPPNPAPSPLMYPQSHLHYPQHSPSPSPYMEKCSPMPHCYKGYNIPPNSQYGRQMSSHSNLKQGAYRSTQNSYGYQQPPSRGYEQQSPLQAMTNPQEPHPKYQHYSQPQQNYCLSELSVRSPEQYYQTCSPSSSHSPARSVGRSPSYSSTPSPLMTNPESFQYGQPPMTPGAASSSSSSSAGIQEQTSTNTMLMPPRSHPSPNVPHAAPHSYTTTPQVPTMKERFSEKLLSNPSLWSLNALTSQVENISNNVQQLLLSEALVANKKGGKRSSGGSNSSAGSGVSTKKGEEYKSPSYPDGGGGSVGGGPMQDPYSTPQHQPMPMELHEGGYSSSSDEQLERSYYYCGQGRSPAQATNNTQLSLDTTSSCSMTSPDDMSTRSGDSGLHNLTPDPSRCQSGQGRDGMSTPVKSIGDERSPTSITIPSPMKQERDSPSDIQHINEPVKENFEESAWTEKSTDKEEVSTDKTLDCERDSDTTKSNENLEKWSDEEKCPALYSKVNKGVTEKSYCYKETVYQEVQSKYDPDARDSVEQSPAALSDFSHKEHFGHEMKSEAFKSESPTASESSVKTLPFISRGDLEQDQYSTEKEDSSENTSPTPQVEALDESNSDKRESRDEEDEEEGEDEGIEQEEADEEEEKEIQKQQQASLSPPLSAEVREELGEGEKMSSTEEHMNNRDGQERPPGDLCSRTDSHSTELYTDNEPAGAPAHPNAAAATAAADASARESAIGDTAPQPQSAMPVFSALNDKTTSQAQTRDHIDHIDAKVLEPDSPQLPGKSILPSASSWADTPPSPKKGDEDMEPGISCASAVTPLAKPEPVAPSAQPRAFGRKHARGRRRIMHSVVGIRRQLSLEREGEKEEEGAPSPTQKPCMPPSKTVLFSDQIDLVHRESIVSQTPKMLTDGFRSRMCTRSFNAPDLPPKVEPHVKRKPGPKSGSKPALKPGPKHGTKPGVKSGPKPGLKPGPKPGTKPGPKQGTKPVLNEPELPLKVETPVKRKPGPKSGSKPGSKPGPKTSPKAALKPGSKPGPNPGPKPEDVLPADDTAPIKASVGRPKGSVSKAKLVQQEENIQPLIGLQSRGRKSPKDTISQVIQDIKPVNHEQKQANHEVKAPEKEGKNMVLRSRKPSQDKLSKEKAKIIGEDILPQTLTEIKASDDSPKVEEPVTVKQTPTPIPNTVKNIDVPADPSAPLAPAVPTEQCGEKTSLPLKRKPSPERFTTPVKKKRGPKPKPKPLPPQPPPLEQVVSTPKEKGVRGPRRKRGPPKKISVVTPPPKDTPPKISETDITSDVPVVPPQCPTRTKVLPPRKGRGQKYEAMVQKITSPSSKKYLLIPQIDSNLTEDVTAKALSQHVLKEGEKSMLINSTEMIEGEVKSIESRQEGVKQPEGADRKEEMTQEREKYEVIQGASTPEELRQGVEEEVVNKMDTRQEHITPGTQQDVETDKVWSTIEAPVEVRAPGKSAQQASEAISSASTKSTRTKRKRWAMVESTDASVVALEAGSLIVTTPRLAKQRAIKNNHEMHLKQKRKKRKGQASLEETETVVETHIETAEQQQEMGKEKVTPTESTIPLPISPDEITEALQVTSTELIQKPRRGRKPSTNSTKRKRGKASSEQIPGKLMKVHKKPGPKPGMKDAMEVIEAVVRAAGCEGAEKEEREKEEMERREREKSEKPETCIVGPVVTISEKQTEIISVKRIRRKPVHQNSKLSFCPYVRINNSRDFSSWCAIVNKPEDAVIFQRRRKKGILRMRNPFTVAKVVPHTAAMLQGPLVKRNLIDRCLTCCLCGKPANYRDLGDLCGPYYTEDGVPRKILTIEHTESLREESQKTNDNNSSSSDEPSNSLKNESKGSTEKESNTEASTQESSSSRHHYWHYRRAERTERMGQEGGPRRLTLRERFRRMKQLQAVSTGASSDQEGGDSVFQRLQVEAESKEHWAHENCTIWTKGVIMVAGRLYGLREAASNSAQTSCYKCQIVGASLSCCWRGCSHKYHYVCAKEIGCTFHDDDFSIKCPKHEDL
ncbi:retinoic acid-induced protein 1 [Cottoperca gobio]|uniref:Retinoic acid-induced protein 1 n=1 Tax=Cottoperca gobio TaxID=56716 RepID=A0A6J2Q630_COTGO|nr:retinoic acid-induced protein 1-like [Cottoperca gobio]